MGLPKRCLKERGIYINTGTAAMFAPPRMLEVDLATLGLEALVRCVEVDHRPGACASAEQHTTHRYSSRYGRHPHRGLRRGLQWLIHQDRLNHSVQPYVPMDCPPRVCMDDSLAIQETPSCFDE